MESAPPVVDESTWDEIEANYFASMRAHREQQSRALEDEYRAKSDEIKSAMLDNFHAQSELLRKLQALKDQHAAKAAELKELESEFKAIQDARARDYAREDETRLAWFRKFRHPDLAYRPADASEQDKPDGEPDVAEAGEDALAHEQAEPALNGDRPADREPVNGHEMEDDDMDGIEVIGGPEFPLHIIASQAENPADDTEVAEAPAISPRAEEPPSNEEPHVEPAKEREVTSTESEQISKESEEISKESEGISKESEEISKESEEISKESEEIPKENEETIPVDASAANGTGLIKAPTSTLETPAVPDSPSSSLSSELSSRHTTPVLDTPVSPAKESPMPATPEENAFGTVEVYNDSGELIGQLLPIAKNNPLVEAITTLPVKRPVQIRKGRKFTAQDLKSIRHPPADDKRGAKWLSVYIQATGEVQGRPCQECSTKYGLFQECVMIDDEDFPRCGNCEWNRRGCSGATLNPPPGSRSGKQPAKNSARSSGGSFTAVNAPSSSRAAKEGVGSDEEAIRGSTKKPQRKALPSTRKSHAQTEAPSTSELPSQSPEDDDAPILPEINKEVLCLRDDGTVFTDPPMMRGVPLAKISPDHPYWESDWVPLEEIVVPQMQRYQEKYERLEQEGTKHRDKHLANRDAKRGRTILKFLEEGELHPYQLVGKEVLNPKITCYEALYRMAQLLMEDLPKFNLDITPSQWLRHRIYELHQEKGNKFSLSHWLEKAYSDLKVEQGRRVNGLPTIGRPPAHRMSKGGGDGESSKKKGTPRALKRKEPHSTPESTPRRTDHPASGNKAPTGAANAAPATGQQKGKGKAKLEGGQPHSGANTPNKKQRLTVKAHGSARSRTPAAADLDDGYTSTDSISKDTLTIIDWRIQQVKTRDIASNPRVTQYWHWVDDKGEGLFEHQVLRTVKPPTWSVFKDPYDFHLRLDEIDRAMHALGNAKVVIAHKKGPNGEDVNPRGDIMAQFKRERTKRRFLSFLKRLGVKLVDVTNAHMEAMWNSLDPETLPAGDSD